MIMPASTIQITICGKTAEVPCAYIQNRTIMVRGILAKVTSISPPGVGWGKWLRYLNPSRIVSLFPANSKAAQKTVPSSVRSVLGLARSGQPDGTASTVARRAVTMRAHALGRAQREGLRSLRGWGVRGFTYAQ
jgi:hypothetical protein